MTSDTVSQDMFTVLHGSPAPVVTRWSYTSTDPFAVTLAVRTRHDRWVEWIVGRELVVEGLDGPAGIGDLRLRPRTVQGYHVIEIEIRTGQGRAVLEVDHDLLGRFLDCTRELVPLGEESGLLDLDATIERITRSRAE